MSSEKDCIRPDDMQESPVGSMFEGRSVFITGASGFIGRVLLEKLLRCYPGIKRIYILMRAKRNQQPYERLHKQLLNVPIFDRIRSMEGAEQLLAKLVVIAGDIAEPQLGISESDLNMMIQDESLAIVFHSAATIKFDEPLKVSVTLNLIATKTIIEICRKLPNLISLCHVSTAYVNSDLKDNQIIEERLYPIEQQPDQLIKMAECMDVNLMQQLKGQLIGERPNTYTYTKALAEHLIAQEASDLPVAIVRPSIVVAAWKEPIPGWIDNLNGPTGLILAIGKGLLRSMCAARDIKAEVIPVDVVVNTMVAAAYYAAKTNNKLSQMKQAAPSAICNNSKVDEELEAQKEIDLIRRPEVRQATAMVPEPNAQEQLAKQDKCPPIIHCNSGDTNPITWGLMEDLFFPIVRKYPSCQVLRYPFGTFKSNKYHDLFVRIFVHYLPALIIDLLCATMGKKRQLLSIYYKLHCATAALSHFSMQNYNFRTNNIRLLQASLNETDRRQLYMDISKLDWFAFWDDYVLGARLAS